jgi:hypothetical protein
VHSTERRFRFTVLEKIKNASSFLGTFASSQKKTLSFVISVHPSVLMYQIGSHWTHFREIWYRTLLEDLSSKSKCGYNLTKIWGTLQGELSTFVQSKVQLDVLFYVFFILRSTCFGCYLHPSSGAHLQRTAVGVCMVLVC